MKYGMAVYLKPYPLTPTRTLELVPTVAVAPSLVSGHWALVCLVGFLILTILLVRVL